MKTAEAAPTVVRERGHLVTPLLSDDDVAALRRLYADLGIRAGSGNYCSIHEQDHELKRRINDAVSSVLRTRLAEIGFVRSRVMGGVFVVKTPTEEHVTPHQDPTLVDEARYRSFNVWVPLQDVDTRNGCLWLLPDSQHDAPRVRPGNGYDHPGYYDRIPTESVWEAMVPIEMAAGEALVYDHRLLHGSRGNHTDALRIAVVGALRAADADLRFFHADPSGEVPVVSEYAMDDGDYFTFVDFVPQSGRLLSRGPVEPLVLHPDEFAQRYPAHGEPSVDPARTSPDHRLDAGAWPA